MTIDNSLDTPEEEVIIDPSERNIDAEKLNFKQLKDLFEPNELSKICSYDLMSSVNGPIYLVAERGVGKTHILKLLYEVLLNRGDISLWMDLKENPILATYNRLKKEHSGYQKKPILWQIAILEEASIKIVNRYLEYIDDPDFRQRPRAIRRQFKKELKENIKEYFSYVRQYRREEWEKYHRFKDAVEKGSKQFGKTSQWLVVEVIVETIRRLINRTVTPSPLSLSVVNVPDKPGENEKENQPVTSQENISDRLLELEAWFWKILRLIQNFDYPDNENQNQFTKHLPKCHSVYVIADGIDQTRQPMSHSDLFALYQATRFLNRKCPQNQVINFKVIMGIRAVTFYYYVDPKDPDRGQMYTDVEKLTWGKEALKQMMARRIVECDRTIVDDRIDDVIRRRFPENVHYFGYKESALDFIFNVTAYRPRQIIILWRKCAELANQEHNAFSISFDEDLIVHGFQQYSITTLPDDIAEEYSSEYKFLDELLEYIAANKGDVERIVSRTDLNNLIQQFHGKLSRHGKKIPNWLSGGPKNITNDVVEVLYKTGIIGIPGPYRESDWLDHDHVYSKPTLNTTHYEEIYIRPHMWTFLTNVQEEIVRRRKYIFSLFSELKNTVADLDHLLNNQNKSQQQEFAYALARFLAISYRIKNYSGYPEPLDWQELEKVKRVIIRSWNYLSLLPNLRIGYYEESALFVESIADDLHKVILLSTYPEELKIEENFFDLENLDKNIRRLRPWVDAYANESPPQIPQEFNDILIQSADSFSNILGRALETIKPFITGA